MRVSSRRSGGALAHGRKLADEISRDVGAAEPEEVAPTQGS